MTVTYLTAIDNEHRAATGEEIRRGHICLDLPSWSLVGMTDPSDSHWIVPGTE